jgi:hypothetical protein
VTCGGSEAKHDAVASAGNDGASVGFLFISCGSDASIWVGMTL